MSFEAVEQAIADRLKEKLGTMVRHIYTAAEISDVDEKAQLSPAIAVIYNGLNPIQNVGNGKVQEIEKAWLVVTHVRSAVKTQTKDGARSESSAIMDKVLEALLGFRPPIEGEGTLRLSNAPGAAFSAAGFAYYPLVFTNRRTFRGTD